LGHNNRQKWHLPFSENKTTNGSAGAILMMLPGDVPSLDSMVFGDSLFACCASLVENSDVIELLFLIPLLNMHIDILPLNDKSCRHIGKLS
jgi:hypothetical protein